MSSVHLSVCLSVTLVDQDPGLENGFETNLGFLGFLKKPKNLKSPKFRFLGFFYFLVKFYANHIKFHIIIGICVFCYIFTARCTLVQSAVLPLYVIRPSVRDLEVCFSHLLEYFKNNFTAE